MVQDAEQIQKSFKFHIFRWVSWKYAVFKQMRYYSMLKPPDYEVGFPKVWELEDRWETEWERENTFFEIL